MAAVIVCLTLVGTAAPASAATGGPTTQSGCGPYIDDTDVPIPDGGPPIVRQFVVSGCPNPGAGKLMIIIRHPYRGDLRVELIPPNGSVYVLKYPNYSDSGDDVLGSYTISMSSQSADGAWKLRVTDVYLGDVGYLDHWSLEF
jgi:serine protease